MSDVTIESLQKDLNTANDNIKGLLAQLEAAKQMVNEGLSSNLQLRTNLNLFQQANQEYLNENHKLRSTVDALSKKILELAPPKVEEPIAA